MERKKSYSRIELRDIAAVVLKATRLLLENGAEARRAFETAQEIGRKFAVGVDILITHRSVIVTIAGPDDTVTRIMRVGTLGVNEENIMRISRTLREMPESGGSTAVWNASLDCIENRRVNYPAWLVLIMASLACGGFCMLSGGDWRAFFACGVAAMIGFYIRGILVKHHFQPMLCIFSAAFISATVATFATRTMGSEAARAGIAASVLYLVPGVPMINAVADVVKGHLMTGLARAMTVLLTAIFVGAGLVLAMRLWEFKY